MTRPVVTNSAGATDALFCERCGDPAGTDTTLRRIGLAGCSSCGLHACQRCWARSAGSCPGCGFSPAGAAIVALLDSGTSTWTRRRADRQPMAATAASVPHQPSRTGPRWPAIVIVATVVLAGSTFAWIIGGTARPQGGVAGLVGMPGTTAGPYRTLDAASGAPGAAIGGVAADLTPTPATGPDVAGDRGGGPTTATPAPPQRTPAPTGSPSPTPTGPSPTSAPTPTASPASCVAEAPRLVGEPRGDAARIWKAAGFTGTVTALPGHGNYVIATQSRTAGADYPCDTDVTVGP
jgi:hypothetical protein